MAALAASSLALQLTPCPTVPAAALTLPTHAQMHPDRDRAMGDKATGTPAHPWVSASPPTRCQWRMQDRQDVCSASPWPPAPKDQPSPRCTLLEGEAAFPLTGLQIIHCPDVSYPQQGCRIPGVSGTPSRPSSAQTWQPTRGTTSSDSHRDTFGTTLLLIPECRLSLQEPKKNIFFFFKSFIYSCYFFFTISFFKKKVTPESHHL